MLQVAAPLGDVSVQQEGPFPLPWRHEHSSVPLVTDYSICFIFKIHK